MEGNDQPPNEFWLPAESIRRIMKQPIPSNANISKESTEAMQICTTKFIHHVTRAANDKCFHDRRTILTDDDILYAMKILGYKDSAQFLEFCMSKYRESVMRADIRSSSRYPPYAQLGPQHGLFQQGSVPPAYAQQGPQHGLLQQGSVPPAYAQQGPQHGLLQQGYIPPAYAQQGPQHGLLQQGSVPPANPQQGPQHGLLQQGPVAPAYAQQGPQHGLFQQGSVHPTYAQQGPQHGLLQQGSVPLRGFIQQDGLPRSSLPRDNSFLQGSSPYFNFPRRSFPPSGRGSIGPRG